MQTVSRHWNTGRSTRVYLYLPDQWFAEVVVSQWIMYAACCWFTHSMDIVEMQRGGPTFTVNLALMSNDGINPSLVWEDAIRKSCYKALNKPGSHPIRFIRDWHFVPGSNYGVLVLLKIMSVCVHGNVLQTWFLGLGLYHMPAPNGVSVVSPGTKRWRCLHRTRWRLLRRMFLLCWKRFMSAGEVSAEWKYLQLHANSDLLQRNASF